MLHAFAYLEEQSQVLTDAQHGVPTRCHGERVANFRVVDERQTGQRWLITAYSQREASKGARITRRVRAMLLACLKPPCCEVRDEPGIARWCG
jgi:hypothetical protein